MAEPLKNIYNPEFVAGFCALSEKHIPNFSTDQFTSFTFSKEWCDMELKQRMLHLTHALNHVLPVNYSNAVECLITISEELKKNSVSESNYEYIFITDYIAVYGLKHFDKSIYAIEKLTQLASAEFAVRPFILQHEREMMEVMLRWSTNEMATVRRLSSEGCRPRLPWGISFPTFKKKPDLILPILENLKQDESLFVRKSVANNLNDISKDNPEIVLSIAKKWFGSQNHTNWIIKHGLRTLLKKGNTTALQLFGFKDINTSSFQVINYTNEVSIGETVELKIGFTMEKKVLIRIEYALGFAKKNNSIIEKIFQKSEKYYEEGDHSITIKQAIKNFSTRKIYTGQHTFCLIVNGKRLEKLFFEVI